nr:MAG TPA: hypothetical protein [Caudoviricetes sp.]
MAKKDNKKNQDINTTVENAENIEETVESPEAEESNAEENESGEESTPIETPVAEEVKKETKSRENKVSENLNGRFIELIVHKDTLDRVTEMLNEYNLEIIVNDEEDTVVVGPLEGDDFNNAVRIVAGCGLMFKI